MPNPLQVHFARPLQADELARLQSLLDPGIEISAGDDAIDRAHIEVLVDGRPTRSDLEASPRLRLLIIPFAGLPPETAELMAEYPQVAMHNLHHNDASTAETALALLLAAARLIVPIDQALRRHDWTPRYDPPHLVTLDGKTVLILGLGAIGQRLARACQALGMRVLATRRRPDRPLPPDLDVEIHPPDALPALLPQAQALVVCLPLTDETEGLIGADELALLPSGALLVNIGRGPIVDEAALFHALADGHLAAAGIDVWYRYPESRDDRAHTPPSALPFHELDNVVMSPHRGGAFGSIDTESRRFDALAHMLNLAARGQPVPNQVDLQLRY